jgi:hypothetical protein
VDTRIIRKPDPKVPAEERLAHELSPTSSWTTRSARSLGTASPASRYADPPLPRTPIKDTDKGKTRFEALYGAGAIEPDAPEATHPGEFGRIVEEHIAGFRDGSLAGKVMRTRRQAHEALEVALQEEAGDHLAAMEEIKTEAAEILRRYQPRLQRLNEELEAELAPLRERLADAGGATNEALGNLEPDLPEPEARPKERRWLAVR